tara:strand:- start:3931 stop:4329 length:399 start_codon:yes stop_codon:yes gene_type:complete
MLEKKLPMQEERRKHTRYDELDLELNVARRGIAGFLKLNPTADCLDFSLSGLQFGCSQPYKIDEKLVLDLKVRDLELNEVNAVVVESELIEPGLYCIRVKFCFQDRHMKNPRIMLALLKIEDSLRVEKLYPS